MDMAAILLSDAEPIGNTFSTEDSMWNQVKIAQAVSEYTFKNYTVLYMYITQGQRQVGYGRVWWRCRVSYFIGASNWY